MRLTPSLGARLKGRQTRFVLMILAIWVGARGTALWQSVATVAGPAMLAATTATGGTGALPLAMAARIAATAMVPTGGTAPRNPMLPLLASPPRPVTVAEAERPLAIPPEPMAVRRATSAYAEALPPAPPPPGRAGRRIEAQAYLFLRPGSRRASLAAGGQLGGSQAAMRIAVPLNAEGPERTAVAARLYAPLASRGAEAAFGLDWHPWPALPLRFSIERRIGLDREGRDAWSAYTAGGFFAGHLPAGLEADGYAQAGVVGARRRDLFVDGALRLGKRLRAADHHMVAGGALWGAAQPGAARLDVGPRASLSLPVSGHVVTAAIEGRLRVAGGAAPGSGAAFTLAADW